jgi:chromosome segregation ATPase
MSEQQDVTVETNTQDPVVENAVETEVEEIEKVESDSPEAESQETEVEAPQETVEEKAERLERETEAKQKAIDRKTAAYHAQQRKIAELQEQITKMNQQPQANDLKEPNIDDFGEYSEYEKAKEEFLTKKVEREIKSKMLQEQHQVEQTKAVQDKLAKRQAQEAEYIKVNPAYSQSANEVSEYLPTLNAPAAVQEAVLEAVYDGNIPQIIDYFGANSGERLDELARIAQLTPAKAAIEIYKIQQSLKAPVKKEVKPAPAPIQKVKGTSALKDLSKGDVLVNLGLKQA